MTTRESEVRAAFWLPVGGTLVLGSVAAFLVKGLFDARHQDVTGSLGVTRQDKPALFESLDTLTAETATPLPKRIDLSANVNASVFSERFELALVLAMDKNLLPALGLVSPGSQAARRMGRPQSLGALRTRDHVRMGRYGPSPVHSASHGRRSSNLSRG